MAREAGSKQYSYCNGKPEATGRDTPKGLLKMNKQPPTAWISNAPMVVNRGDRITVAILAYSDPLGRGSSEGFSLKHLRLRVAGGHSSARTLFSRNSTMSVRNCRP